MNIELLSSTSPLGMRTAQTADFTKGVSQRKGPSYPFPTLGSVTVSNNTATSRAITNPKIYSFVTGGPTAPVVNMTDVRWLGGTPVMVGLTNAYYNCVGYPNPTDQYGYGRPAFECLVNASQFDIAFLKKTYSVTVEVDGVIVYVSSGAATATAQAGAAGSITLAAGESSTNNALNQIYIYILSGTGAGQRKRITAYNGTTKVATVDSNWSVTPDNTSVYVTGWSPSIIASGADGGASTFLYPTFTFSGERTEHLVRVYSRSPLASIAVDSSGTVMPTLKTQRPRLFYIGDSFNATQAPDSMSSTSEIVARALGMECFESTAGSTGIIAGPTTKTTYKQRTCPPKNSWLFNSGQASGGTYTLTQGAVTTASIAYNDSLSAIQTKLDTAFGAGMWQVSTCTALRGFGYVLIGLSTNAEVTSDLTITSSLTGTVITPYLQRYLGDITPNIPVDGFGNPLPFYIFVQGSTNDINSYATLQAAAEDFFAALQARFPTAIIMASGTTMNTGPMSGNALLATAALENAGAKLPYINGKSAFFALFDKTTGVGYLNGSTNVTNAAGAAGVNTDYYVCPDGVHPSPFGIIHFASVLARNMAEILAL